MIHSWSGSFSHHCKFVAPSSGIWLQQPPNEMIVQNFDRRFTMIVALGCKQIQILVWHCLELSQMYMLFNLSWPTFKTKLCLLLHLILLASVCVVCLLHVCIMYYLQKPEGSQLNFSNAWLELGVMPTEEAMPHHNFSWAIPQLGCWFKHGKFYMPLSTTLLL
jgi:hypothetical protein